MDFTSPTYGLLILSAVLFLAILASKTSGRIGVPSLVLFLALGWAFGPSALDLIRVSDYEWVRKIGIMALSIILFSGGLDTRLESVRPVLGRSISLATVGVLITALVTAVSAWIIFDFTFAEAFLLGAIVSSTDAAAIFSVLRSKSIGLKHRLRPLLEFESGSNDPMALLLTVTAIGWVTGGSVPVWKLALQLVYQLGAGAAIGLIIGYLTLRFINRVSLQYEGLFSVLILSVSMFTYAVSELAMSNGLMASYMAGIMIGNRPFMHKQGTLKFFDGVAWLMQILIFVALGLILEPRGILHVAIPGVLLALAIIFVARCAGVFGALLPFRGVSAREKAFISWAGLKGAAPLVFALYPLLAISDGVGGEVARVILHVVYFVVILSVVIQGTLLTRMASWLGVDFPVPEKVFYPLAIEQRDNFQSQLQEIELPADCPALGKPLVALRLPADSLIVLISRGDQFIMPNGSTALNAYDKLLVMASTVNDLEGVYYRLGLGLPDTT